MKITLIQPPYAQQSDLFGVRVSALLSNTGANQYTHFSVATAFTRLTGVGRLADDISSFQRRGGKAILVSGVDMRGTTYQGLEQALSVFDEVYVYHDSDPQRTFHPKLFVLKGATSAAVLIGSNNLTAGGLYNNYELATLVELDLSIADDKTFLDEVENLFTSYCSTNTVSSRVNTQLLNQLLKDGLLSDETRPDPRPRVGSVSGGSSRRSRSRNQFATPPPLPTKFAKMLQRKVPTGLRPVPPAHPKPTQLVPGLAGGFWKRLSKNDVSLTSSPGQIIIPKAYVTYFPPLLPTANPYLQESNLSTEFVDRNGNATPAPDSRLILYVPKPGQPRPNIEYRFTFRDQDILSNLSVNDVLVFEPRPAPYQFRVWHVPDTSAAASSYVGRNGII